MLKNDIAHDLCTTAYRLKQGLLDIYMKQQLKNPSIKLTFA